MPDKPKSVLCPNGLNGRGVGMERSVDYDNAYLTLASKVYGRHSSPVILHENWHWHLGEFPSMEKFLEFAKTVGVLCTWVKQEVVKDENGDDVRIDYYSFDRKFAEGSVICHSETYGDFESESFWHLSELPDDVRPILGLSNGNLVTCYFRNDGKTVYIYRPNPNAEEVYKPMGLDAHIKYSRENGSI